MNTDISFDLETLGVDPGCVITQIGACAFDVDDPIAERQQFNTFVDPQSCLDLGMTIKWTTIAWWLVQPEAARNAMITKDTQHISLALTELSRWIAAVADPKLVCVWGHGATFDISLLEDAYRRCHLPVPWFYRNVRDLRTLRALAPDSLVLTAPSGTLNAHVAVDDAIMQADWITQCAAAIRHGQNAMAAGD
jgi:DNA polymerase III epsilon subunit-like protein